MLESLPFIVYFYISAVSTQLSGVPRRGCFSSKYPSRANFSIHESCRQYRQTSSRIGRTGLLFNCSGSAPHLNHSALCTANRSAGKVDASLCHALPRRFRADFVASQVAKPDESADSFVQHRAQLGHLTI